MSKVNEKFSAVGMKRKIQAEIYEETKNFSPEEEIEYYHKAAEHGVLGKLFTASHKKSRTKREDSVKMMRDIRAKLNERYKQNPACEREDLLSINKKYKIQPKPSSSRRKTA